MSGFKFKLELGVPKTIGELRKMIQTYPDDTDFGFHNQPVQMLYARRIEDTLFVGFEQIIADNYLEELNQFRNLLANIVMSTSYGPNGPDVETFIKRANKAFELLDKAGIRVEEE